MNTSWGLEKAENVFLIGGSDYSNSSEYLEELTFKNKSFNINIDGNQRLVYNRTSASLSTMKTDNENIKIVLVLGGVQ